MSPQKEKEIISCQNQIIKLQVLLKVFHRKLISNRNEKKNKILMNKPVYLELSILELSKILMYQFWYDYVKQKYGEKAKLRYMDRDRSIVYVKT